MIGFILVLSSQGVVEVLRRKWAKMTPKEKAPYEAMEAEFKKSQLTDKKLQFFEYYHLIAFIVVLKTKRDRNVLLNL